MRPGGVRVAALHRFLAVVTTIAKTTAADKEGKGSDTCRAMALEYDRHYGHRDLWSFRRKNPLMEETLEVGCLLGPCDPVVAGPGTSLVFGLGVWLTCVRDSLPPLVVSQTRDQRTHGRA